jgi:predicted N-acetyltransferase YhbS
LLIRVADPEDAEAVSNVINAAFRKAESFLMDRDRIDLPTVRELLRTGAFLVAERNQVVVGCVHVEMRARGLTWGCCRSIPRGRCPAWVRS